MCLLYNFKKTKKSYCVLYLPLFSIFMFNLYFTFSVFQCIYVLTIFFSNKMLYNLLLLYVLDLNKSYPILNERKKILYKSIKVENNIDVSNDSNVKNVLD